MRLAVSFPGTLVLVFALGGCTESVKGPVQPEGGAQSGNVIVCAPGSFTSGNECIPVKAAECPSGTTGRDGQCVADQEVTIAELKAAAKTGVSSGEYDDVLDTRRNYQQPRARALLITEIQGLEALFQAVPKDAADRPPLMRRLAEGYVELAAAAARDRGQATDAPSAEKATKLERAAHGAAIKYYTLLVDQYPAYCRSSSPAGKSGCADEPLYYLGLEHLRSGQPENARKTIFRLIQGWPSSDKMGAAYFLFGEMFRSEAPGDPTKWAFVEQTFAKAAEYPGALQIPALLRLAEAYDREGKAAEAEVTRKKAQKAQIAAPGGGPQGTVGP